MPVLRPRPRPEEVASDGSALEDDETAPLPVSSILPRRVWVLSLLIAGGILSWISVIGTGIWLDSQQIDPWREIFGLASGRLLRFYNTIALLTCSQLSYLILWRRSRSRKDFAGKYRVWFWVGAVCSIFCVATATRFHENWAGQLTRRMSSHWQDWATICWLVPATSMLLSALHLMRRDMPFRSASTSWVQVSRGCAVIAGVSVLVGSSLWPSAWVAPINAALCSLWPTLFAASLLIHARFVTYVTNEAMQERRQPSRTSRWEARVKLFARHVARMASEEWQLHQANRAAAKAANASKASGEPETAPVERPPQTTKRPRKSTTPSISSKTSAPLKEMGQQQFSSTSSEEYADSKNSADAEDLPDHTSTSAPQGIRSSGSASSINVHPAQPIPAPHFDLDLVTSVDAESAAQEELASQSESIPAGYSREQWKNLSKKDRKRLQRVESMR